jgi:hypothetical protein
VPGAMASAVKNRSTFVAIVAGWLFAVLMLLGCTADPKEPYPVERVAAHRKQFNAVVAFMEKRNFQPCRAADSKPQWKIPTPEFKWFQKRYPAGPLVWILVTMSPTGEFQTKMACENAPPQVMSQITSDWQILSSDLASYAHSIK